MGMAGSNLLHCLRISQQHVLLQRVEVEVSITKKAADKSWENERGNKGNGISHSVFPSLLLSISLDSLSLGVSHVSLKSTMLKWRYENDDTGSWIAAVMCPHSPQLSLFFSFVPPTK